MKFKNYDFQTWHLRNCYETIALIGRAVEEHVSKKSQKINVVHVEYVMHTSHLREEA